MWIADRWKDYEVIDTSNGEKLERWGDYILVRPDPQVIWNTPHKEPRWNGSSLISRRHGRSIMENLCFICSHFSLSTRDFFRSRQ